MRALQTRMHVWLRCEYVLSGAGNMCRLKTSVPHLSDVLFEEDLVKHVYERVLLVVVKENGSLLNSGAREPQADRRSRAARSYLAGELVPRADMEKGGKKFFPHQCQ